MRRQDIVRGSVQYQTQKLTRERKIPTIRALSRSLNELLALAWRGLGFSSLGVLVHPLSPRHGVRGEGGGRVNHSPFRY
jgi:hypothetical protein